MNLTRDRMHIIGWGVALAICFALVMLLTFRVNAVKSQVHLADREIARLKQEKLFLETEFETRASQQQLQAFNQVDFGYQAPKAEQYLENERQLAALGKPRSVDAPSPIRVASAEAVSSETRLMPALAQQGSAVLDIAAHAGEADDKPVKSVKRLKPSELSDHLAQLGARAGHRE
ncbi:hypothetical protein EOE18_00565 [Novosphingobium umbonatum]|jgi:hypothetical protein|uniref:Uncharacterized protein n=1 Tax=Novosphingobium umbonatum TaxID=1908524 RepID=A0A3S2YB38_9SPHN|nr:hypothetical protein [Novosphingobium umbonatum]RVU07616.1 hypothetical protein EOE18_00565 [Novosphingobium umbonatum]